MQYRGRHILVLQRINGLIRGDYMDFGYDIGDRVMQIQEKVIGFVDFQGFRKTED